MRLEIYISGRLFDQRSYQYPVPFITEKGISVKERLLRMIVRRYLNEQNTIINISKGDYEVYAVFQSQGNYLTDEELDDK